MGLANFEVLGLWRLESFETQEKLTGVRGNLYLKFAWV